MRSAVGRESTTFGFSIMVTVGFGVLQGQQGTPSTGDLFLYAIGAVLSFTTLETILSRAFRQAMPQHESEVVAVGTAMNVASVVGGVASAYGVARAVGPDIAWLLAPFAAGIAYLVLEGLEVLLAEAVLRRAGDRRAAETEG
jgi:ABC-type arginine/histidine transport system permease subunit